MAIYHETPLDRIFHALGDPTRRRMIALLAENGPRTAGELGRPVQISQPAVSKHLKVLETAGLVERSIEGRVHSFCLNSEPLDQADKWINRHRKFWQGSMEQLGDLVNEINSKDQQHEDD